MTGNQHGIKNGWFMYPLLFDPIWATKECNNLELIELAFSEPVSLAGKSV